MYFKENMRMFIMLVKKIYKNCDLLEFLLKKSDKCLEEIWNEIIGRICYFSLKGWWRSVCLDCE